MNQKTLLIPFVVRVLVNMKGFSGFVQFCALTV